MSVLDPIVKRFIICLLSCKLLVWHAWHFACCSLTGCYTSCMFWSTSRVFPNVSRTVVGVLNLLVSLCFIRILLIASHLMAGLLLSCCTTYPNLRSLITICNRTLDYYNITINNSPIKLIYKFFCSSVSLLSKCPNGNEAYVASVYNSGISYRTRWTWQNRYSIQKPAVTNFRDF